MLTQFSRTELLLGKEAMDRLKNARVAVFGIGGVGGYVCEALVRTGVGYFDLIDDDKVCLTNLNRQIIATRKTVGKYKTEVMKERMLEINPDVKVEIHDCFFLPENAKDFPFEEYDYVVDAVEMAQKIYERPVKVTKDIYPVIARKYKSTPSNVEHNIRTLVNLCWMNHKDTLEEMAGCTMADKPTNSEFIDILVYYLRYSDKD